MFNTLTDPILQAAFWTGAAALMLTLVSALQIVFLRLGLRRRQRINAETVAKWRPILQAAVVGEIPGQLPPLRKKEYAAFLQLWTYLHESIRGESSEALNEVGRRLGCDRIAHALVDKRGRSQRLLAILVLGRLRNKPSWQGLRDLAQSPDSIVSIYAFWAMVRIDPDEAIKQLMPLVAVRSDWPVTRLVLILQEAGENCASALNTEIAMAAPEKLPRLLQIAEALHFAISAEVLSDLMRTSSTEVLVAALKLVDMPALLGQARSAAVHPDWRVRMQAAKALGRVGGPNDITVLKSMLSDGHWWVRYRAAGALLSLPFLSMAALEELTESLNDRFAIDAMRHVMAEKGIT